MTSTRVADLCGLAALAAVFGHGGFAIGGPGGYGALDVAATVDRFEPLAVASHALDGWLGLATVHLMLLAAGAAALTALVAARTGSRWVAGAAGVLFAVHPAFGEAFVWAPARGALLALPLLFLAHRAWLKGGTRRTLLTALWFVLAGLSWHAAWLYGIVLAFEIWKHGARVPAVFVALVGVAAYGLPLIADSGRAGDPGILAQVIAAVTALGIGALDVVAPHSLHVDTGVDAHGHAAWLGVGAWVGLVLLLSAIIAACVMRRALWVVAVGFIGLVVAVSVFPAEEPVLSHARLGLAVAAFAVGVALVVSRWAGSFWRTPVLGLLVLALGVVAALRAPELTSARAMWTASHAAHASYPRTLVHSAAAALDAPDTQGTRRAAVEPLVMALPAGDDVAGYRTRGLLTLCEALVQDGDVRALLNVATEVITHLRTFQPTYQLPQGYKHALSQAHRYHGQAMEAVAGRGAALESFRRAEQYNSRNVDALMGYARVLAGSGAEDDLAHAAELLQRAFTVDGSRTDVARGLARVYVLSGKPSEAFKILDRARNLHGDTPALLFARARAHLSGSRNVAKAEEILRRIQEMDPKRTHQEAAQLQAEIHVAVGRRLFERARSGEKDANYQDALDRFDAAIRAAPSHWEADVFAGDALVALEKFDEARTRYDKAKSGAAWVKGLIARTAVLQAGAVLARRTTDVAKRAEAAGFMAQAIQAATRLDMGYTPFEAEIPLLREVVKARADKQAAPRADALLLSARAIVAGDHAEAARELVSARVADTSKESGTQLDDAALLMQAILYERSGNLLAAKRTYQELARRRDGDPLPTLRNLQIDMRIALAHRKTALAFPDETARLKQTAARVARIAERIVSYATAYPERLDAQLLAAEADMHQSRWIESMQRLNVQQREHPEDPTVLRGLATVYMEHHAATGDPDLLRLAGNEVRKALTMDPRDIRALLDQAQIAAKSQDFAKAIRFAQEAQRFDPLTRGPATRLLSDLHLAKAQRMLEGGQADLAMKAVRDARKADPAGAGSYLWEGKVLLAQATHVAKAERLARALTMGNRAKELAPFDGDVDAFLASVHRQLGFAATLKMNVRTRNPDPREDKAFDAWDEAEQTKRIERFDAINERDAARKVAFRAAALAHYDQALALDPRGEDADETRARASSLRSRDPKARGEQIAAARAAYDRGEKLRYEGESLKAMRRYQEAIALNPGLGRAHYWLVTMAYKELIGVRMDDAAEKRFAERTLSVALASLHALDALDAEQRFALRWYLRGQLNKWMYRTFKSEAARHAARGAYKRFLSLMARVEGREAPEVERARVHLDALTRSGER